MGEMSQDEARRYWNEWNAEAREHRLDRVSLEQAQAVDGWLAGRQGLSILEAGCGAGWMCERLAKFGTVVGIDQADEVVERARQRVPSVTFVAGDLLEVDLGSGYDVAVSLEVLAHVADQPMFLRRLRDALKPGGQLFLATQNKPVLSRFNRIPPPGEGQLRRWVDRAELRQLVEAASFRVEEMFVITPQSNFGLMRVLAKASRMTKTDKFLARLGFGWTIMLSARAV
jgi:2-polyprenyl-3-methyl-5-hydroxy-6-metoxy-1,4-benzoquinol methylase